MKSIQLVLLACVLGGTTLFFTRMRSRVIDRMLVLVFAAAAATLAVFPDISGWMAIGLQVGRGVDVIIYFMLLFLWYVCLLLYSKLRGQEGRLVELTRSIAIANARLCNETTIADSKRDACSADKDGDIDTAGNRLVLVNLDDRPESNRVHEVDANRAQRLNPGRLQRRAGREPAGREQSAHLLRLDEFRGDRSLFQDDGSRQGIAGYAFQVRLAGSLRKTSAAPKG